MDLFPETKDVDESFSRKAYCPFDGSYSVKYSYDKYSKYNCAQLDTTVDSCPSGSILNTRFPKCYNQNLGKHSANKPPYISSKTFFYFFRLLAGMPWALERPQQPELHHLLRQQVPEARRSKVPLWGKKLLLI